MNKIKEQPRTLHTSPMVVIVLIRLVITVGGRCWLVYIIIPFSTSTKLHHKKRKEKADSSKYYFLYASQEKEKNKRPNLANIIFYMIPSWLTLELKLTKINNCALFWICLQKPVNGRKRCERGDGFFLRLCACSTSVRALVCHVIFCQLYVPQFNETIVATDGRSDGGRPKVECNLAGLFCWKSGCAEFWFPYGGKVGVLSFITKWGWSVRLPTFWVGVIAFWKRSDLLNDFLPERERETKKKEKRGYDEVRRNRPQYMEKKFGHSVPLWRH